MSNRIKGFTGIKGLFKATLPLTARNLRRLEKKNKGPNVRVRTPASEARQEATHQLLT